MGKSIFELANRLRLAADDLAEAALALDSRPGGPNDLSSNFSWAEFECRCGCGLALMDRELLVRLQRLRDLVGRIVINSGTRCPVHNRRVGGRSASYHLSGQAADIRAPGLTVQEMFDAAVKIGFRGVIGYPGRNFIHVDVRPEPYYEMDGHPVAPGGKSS